MCHFITATIPKSASIIDLNDIARNHHLQFYEIHNAFVESQLPKSLTYLSKVTNHCDCGTVLGSFYHSSIDGFTIREKEIKKLRNKGWGEVKIKRWIDEKNKYKNKLMRETADKKDRWSPEAKEWHSFINMVVSSTNIRKFGLLLHMYRGGPETEKIKLKKTDKISIKEIDHQYLMKIQEDIFYQFTK
jgi:hypothetical protein